MILNKFLTVNGVSYEWQMQKKDQIKRDRSERSLPGPIPASAVTCTVPSISAYWQLFPAVFNQKINADNAIVKKWRIYE